SCQADRPDPRSIRLWPQTPEACCVEVALKVLVIQDTEQGAQSGNHTMRFWLLLSSGIDAVNRRVGLGVSWLILLMTLVSAFNAVSRKALSISSNAFLEIQWYLFAAVFLLAAGYTLLSNEHV